MCENASVVRLVFPPFVFVTAVVRVKNGGEKGFARNIVNGARIYLKLVLNDVESQGDHFLVC